MKEKRGIRRFLRLAGMAAVLTAGMAGAKPDKVQAEQMVPEMSVLSAEGNGLDSNTGAAGKVILKQSLKEEELAALKRRNCPIQTRMERSTVWQTGRCGRYRGLQKAAPWKRRPCIRR